MKLKYQKTTTATGARAVQFVTVMRIAFLTAQMVVSAKRAKNADSHQQTACAIYSMMIGEMETYTDE